MRLPVVLASMLTVAPACALDVADMPTWSAEAHVVRHGTSLDTVLVFQRTGQVTNVKTKAWKSHKGTGTARMHEGFVTGDLGGFGRVVVAGDRLSVDSPKCASGPVTLGTGD
jgi:hypothetical protein